MMTHHCLAGIAAAPVVAGAVVVAMESRAVRLRTGEDVVHVGRVAAAIHFIPLLGERGVLVDAVVRAVQIVHVPGDHNAFCVLPRTFADAIARVNRGLVTPSALAQVGAPRLEARAGSRSELVAMLVCSGEATEIRALPVAGAGDEEGHLCLLCQ